jgi:hypothetical protein
MSFQASANIRPSRFVKRSGANTVAECGAGEVMIGISAEGSNYPPLPSQTEYAAASGDPCSIIFVGDGAQEDRPVLLVLGSGGATQGGLLKSDSAGAGVAVASNNDVYGAMALESGSSGEAIRVRLVFGYYGA